MEEHVCVKFGDPYCSGFSDIVQINRKTDRQTRRWKPYPATAVGVGKNKQYCPRNV